MKIIDAEWLRERLGNNRGEQAELSRVTGISTDKISKILSGVRKVQPNEIPLIAKFFDEQTTALPEPEDKTLREFIDVWPELTEQERRYLLSSAKGLASQDRGEAE